MASATVMSADELLQLPDDGFRYELVRGELRKTSLSGARHGEVASNISASLGRHVRQNRLGRLYIADVGFRLSRNPDTVRAPDVAFVRAERAVSTPGFFEGPPDVVFEVVSPSDSYSEIDEKTLDWLRAGTRVVVIADPRTMSVRVHRSAGAHSVTDFLELDDVIPGWRMPLAEIFE
jgi:Uma2 family endonuclease